MTNASKVHLRKIEKMDGGVTLVSKAIFSTFSLIYQNKVNFQKERMVKSLQKLNWAFKMSKIRYILLGGGRGLVSAL